MRFFLDINRNSFDSNYVAGLSSSIYVPLNSGRYVGREVQPNAPTFKTTPDSKSINLADWITNQINLGNISLSGTDTNIYNTDGTISVARTVTLGASGTLTVDTPTGAIQMGDVSGANEGNFLSINPNTGVTVLGDEAGVSSSAYIKLDGSDPSIKLSAGGAFEVTYDGNIGTLNLSQLYTYADEAAAATAGIINTGDIYKTATGELRVKL